MGDPDPLFIGPGGQYILAAPVTGLPPGRRHLMKVLRTELPTPGDAASKDLSSVRRERLNFGFACLSGYLKARGHA